MAGTCAYKTRHKTNPNHLTAKVEHGYPEETRAGLLAFAIPVAWPAGGLWKTGHALRMRLLPMDLTVHPVPPRPKVPKGYHTRHSSRLDTDWIANLELNA